jgi:hypothetical protein
MHCFFTATAWPAVKAAIVVAVCLHERAYWINPFFSA